MYVCMYTCVYVYMYMYMYVYVCVCVYVYTYIGGQYFSKSIRTHGYVCRRKKYRTPRDRLKRIGEPFLHLPLTLPNIMSH